MTKDETITIMAVLDAFYANGKGNPKAQANAWFLVLEKYDYDDAMRAVLRFAENDHRDYATFPAVGKIVQEIRNEAANKRQLVDGIIRAVAYGRQYSMLKKEEQELISESEYSYWLSMNAIEYSNRTDEFATFLRGRQARLLTGGDTNESGQHE